MFFFFFRSKRKSRSRSRDKERKSEKGLVIEGAISAEASELNTVCIVYFRMRVCYVNSPQIHISLSIVK